MAEFNLDDYLLSSDEEEWLFEDDDESDEENDISNLSKKSKFQTL